MRIFLFLLSFLCCSGLSMAQQASKPAAKKTTAAKPKSVAAEKQPACPPPPMEIVLPVGTFLDLETTETLASDRVKRGQTVQLRARSDVWEKGVRVIRSGALAYGYIVEAGNNFSYNEPAYIIVAPDRVQTVEGKYIKLHGKPEPITGEDTNTIVKLEPMYIVTANTMNRETIVVAVE